MKGQNVSVEWGTRWATGVYRALLVVFPRPFREKYGAQLVRTFRDAASDAMDRRGRPAMLVVCLRMVAELILHAPKEHVVGRRHSRRARGATSPAARNVWRDLLHDIAYSVRTMRKNATFAVVAVVTLALGIGANTAIFSVVYSVTLRPLPYEAPGELAWLSMAFGGRGAAPQPFPASEPEYLELKDQADSYTDIAAYLNFTSRVNLGGLEEPQRVPSASVTANFLTVLGVQPQVGRGFAAGEDRPGAEAVVILAYGLWQRAFGGDDDVVGRSLLVNGGPATVVGVMPETFRFPGWDVELLRMNVIDPSNPGRRSSHYLAMIGRLRSDATLESARAEIDGLTARWSSEFPERHGPNPRHPIVAHGLHQRIVGDVGPVLLVLAGSVSLVLLIACANVANLTLARAETRQREMAVRVALGAGRGRLISQLLTESTVIAVLGGTVGVALAFWGVQFVTAAGPADLPRLQEIRIDGVALAFTALASIGTGLVFGLIPAISASRRDVNAAFKEGSAASTVGGRRMSFRRALVAVEIAFAVILVVGAGLFIKSFARLRNVDPGFDPNGVVTMDFSLANAAYPEPSQMARFHADLVARVGALPGVRSAGSIRVLPLRGAPGPESLTLINRTRGEDEHWNAQLQVAGPDYFDALKIPLLSGRTFAAQDGAGGQPVVVLNQTMAEMHWPDGDALGKQLKLGPEDSAFPLLTVVGVAGDVRQAGLAGSVAPQIFVPRQQAEFVFSNAARTATLVVRSDTDPVTTMRSVRQVIRDLDSQLPVANMQTMERVVAGSVSDERFLGVVMGFFSGVALLLGAVGIYGLMAYSVVQRTREIGLRVALGADRQRVLGLVVRQAMGMTFAGVGAGLVAALAATRMVSGLLFDVGAWDPTIFIGAPAVLVGVAMIAAYVPGRRATGVDPMMALNSE